RNRLMANDEHASLERHENAKPRKPRKRITALFPAFRAFGAFRGKHTIVSLVCASGMTAIAGAGRPIQPVDAGRPFQSFDVGRPFQGRRIARLKMPGYADAPQASRPAAPAAP